MSGCRAKRSEPGLCLCIREARPGRFSGQVRQYGAFSAHVLFSCYCGYVCTFCPALCLKTQHPALPAYATTFLCLLFTFLSILLRHTLAVSSSIQRAPFLLPPPTKTINASVGELIILISSPDFSRLTPRHGVFREPTAHLSGCASFNIRWRA